MLNQVSPAFTWRELLEHLEQLWGRPRAEFLPELLAYLRHELIAGIEPVLVGSKILVSLYELPAGPRAWLNDCVQTADAWVWGCRQASDSCIEQGGSPADQCRCFLAQIGPVFGDCARLLDACPRLEVDGASREEVDQIFGAVKTGLARLAEAAAGVMGGDLAWLKAVFDENDRKRRGSS